MKIEEQVLSVEQMYHLQELCVDMSDASMRWVGNDVVPNSAAFDLGYDGIFTYTIGDLIEKLPKEVDDNRLEICLADKTIGYVHFGVCAYHEDYDNLIDGLYDCLCWVVENHKELLEVKK